jgi:acetyltransferase
MTESLISKVMHIPSLHDIFYAKGVAIIGASANPLKPGYKILQNLLNFNYSGGIFPVNPRSESILGLKCYRSVLDIEGEVNIAIFTVPAQEVIRISREELVRRRMERGDIMGAVVIGGGFREMGEEGAVREAELRSIFISSGMRLIGPNCQGLINVETGLNTTFDTEVKPKAGGVSIATQSGALGNGVVRMATARGHFGLDKFLSFGNMGDVDAAEAMEYYAELPTTKVIAAYLEDVPDGRRFFGALRKGASRKPVVVLKAGRTQVGAQAASSHTGALSSEDRLWDAVIRQAGAVRAYTLKEFYDVIRLFEKLPPFRGPRVAVLTVVGGPGTLCVDRISNSRNISMARFSEDTKKKLAEILAPTATVGRPDGYVDMTGSVTDELHGEALEIVLKDEGVDAVVFLEEPPSYLSSAWASTVVGAYSRQKSEAAKPVVAVVVAGDAVIEHIRVLEEGGIPTFEQPEAAVDALDKVIGYYMRRRAVEEPAPYSRSTHGA